MSKFEEHTAEGEELFSVYVRVLKATVKKTGKEISVARINHEEGEDYYLAVEKLDEDFVSKNERYKPSELIIEE